jgi:hypothetical protein
MDFTQFKNEWLGKRVDYDRQYNWQCVDLIRQYIYECYQIPGGGGVPSAISYWTTTPADILSKFYKIESSEAQQGDIVMLRTLGRPDYSGDGHIGIATGNIDASNLEILEQNGSTGNGSGEGGDAIRTRYVPRTRVAGLLRPIYIPAPTPPVEVHPYTIELIDPKQVRINKATHRWGMTYDNFTAIANNPLYEVAEGTIIVVSAICHHNIGYNYYLPDPSEPSGFNVLDCDDYTPPPPPPPPVTTPAAPISYPTTDEQYTVVTTILGFTTSNSAINHINAVGTVAPSTYFIYNKKFNEDNTALLAVNVSKVKGQAGSWINVNDNFVPPPPPPEPTPVPEPVVEVPVVVTPTPTPVVQPSVETEADVRMSFLPFTHDEKPISCFIKQNVLVTDRMKNGNPITLKKGGDVNIYGTFKQGGKWYAMPRKKSDVHHYYMYGVPIKSRTNLEPFLDDIYDFGDHIRYGLERVYDSFRQTIDGFFRLKTKNKEK